MSQHTPPPSQAKQKRCRPCLPRGRAKLVALRVAFEVIGAIRQLPCPGEAHLRDHLVRAAKNTGLALSEASGSTGGNRRLHLERAYSENQEVQSDLEMLVACGIDVPDDVAAQADRLGGLIYGLLRSCIRDG